MTLLHRILWIKRGTWLSAESEGWWNWIIWMELASELDMVTLQPPGFLCLGVDDFDKLGLEGGSANEETVNILLGGEFFAGTTGHRTWEEEHSLVRRQKIQKKVNMIIFISSLWLTSIDDPHRVGYSLRNIVLQPPPQFFMNLLSLRCNTGNRHFMIGSGKKKDSSNLKWGNIQWILVLTCSGEAVLPVPMAQTGS